MRPGENMDVPPAFSTKGLLTWLGFMAALLGTVLLLLFLSDRPYGVRVVCLVGDTVWVSFLVFCDSRYWRGYSLRNNTVRQELPLLLRVHCLFLLFLFSGLTLAISAQSQLPSSWVVERGQRRPSFFVSGLICVGVTVSVTGAWFCRRILRRAFEARDSLTMPNGGQRTP
jgi:hypothetical protein